MLATQFHATVGQKLNRPSERPTAAMIVSNACPACRRQFVSTTADRVIPYVMRAVAIGVRLAPGLFAWSILSSVRRPALT